MLIKAIVQGAEANSYLLYNYRTFPDARNQDLAC